MFHERILVEDDRRPANVAAVWPASAQIAPLPIPDVEERPPIGIFQATPAASDVPAGVGALIVASYCALVASLALATVASRESAFAIAIVALFLVAFFTVPRLFFGTEPANKPRPTLDRFLHEGMETLTGHCSGRAALVQMLIVPVLLTVGILAMGVAVAIYL